MLTECHPHEMGTATERILRNALKFGTAGEVNLKEGVARAEGLELVPPNCIESVSPQGELYVAVGEL